MKTPKFIVWLFFPVYVALTILSCGPHYGVPSLHPLYTEKDLIFNPAILGKWYSNEELVWEFTKVADKEYKLIWTFSDNGEINKSAFIAHLVKIGEIIFLDLFPALPECPQGVLSRELILPVHTFLLIRETEPTLKVGLLDSEGLVKFLNENPKAIKHEKVDIQKWKKYRTFDADGNYIVLTASTEELKKFFIKHWKDAFPVDEKDGLKRKVKKENNK